MIFVGKIPNPLLVSNPDPVERQRMMQRYKREREEDGYNQDICLKLKLEFEETTSRRNFCHFGAIGKFQRSFREVYKVKVHIENGQNCTQLQVRNVSPFYEQFLKCCKFPVSCDK